jgi:TetR/AcrR family transcriptional regulator, acrAB operon repressor
MDIAIDCFARYGYRATSIDRIANAAGVTKGALYYHFKDKEDLLFEAVRNRVGQFERRVIGDLVPVHDAVQALRQLTALCIEHATKSNHRRFIVTLMVEALDNNARLSTQFLQMMERFRSFLEGIVAVGQQDGTFRTDVSAAAAARVFTGAVMGAEVQYYQDPVSFNLEETLGTFLEQHLLWLGAVQGRRPRRK